MKTGREHSEVIEEIKTAIETSTKKSKRVLCKTLLKQFGFNVKTKERAALLGKLFAEAGINVFPSILEADREDWITLSLVNPAVPVSDFVSGTTDVESPVKSDDPWFDNILSKSFDSEREVEIRFILPLLDRLGYDEDDRADGYPVEIYEGVRRATKEADFVLFDGRNRSKDNALLVIEAKATGKKLQDYIGQARTYAIWLGTPYYLVTNGDEIRVFLFRSAIESDVEVFSATRHNLKAAFANLYNLISKPAIVEYKRRKKAGAP